ncbi:FkbM family methyltransferase [Anabaenopsis elenkinii]|uniref:FkbM family methyltransferase n=1 Tax=Anabaenopsis elenkinii CCIBt3563 TaxID=2779889 RepID=A0A7S6RE95_9CYAN|nr:FkbM family methyltransferase [Anabaenopsis elenkinii]QOV23334.1 FkbM family methyltransferase [Anabaenopsis elenkinii CCIBt3563]
MSKLLSFMVKFLRSKLIHPKLSYKIWQLLCKLNHGQSFFFPLRSSGNFPVLMYGGICGYSDSAIFFESLQYEQENIAVYRSILIESQIPVVIDVGANNGQSLMTIKFINPETQIHCFEPFPQLTNFLNELVNINNFQDVHINNNILSDTLGLGKLFFAKNSTDTASTVNDFQSFYDRSLTVEKITLDGYCQKNKINHISLIKIDVEGGN